MSPNIYKGDIHGNSPHILEVMSFRMSTRVTATVVCGIVTQILCVVAQKSFSWGTPLPGSAPGPSQTPSLHLCSPSNLVRSTPLPTSTLHGHGHRLPTRPTRLYILTSNTRDFLARILARKQRVSDIRLCSHVWRVGVGVGVSVRVGAVECQL